MLRTFDHYYNALEETNDLLTTNVVDEHLECFICYETKRKKEDKPISLQKQIRYIKICECDGLIHKKCLKKWVNLNNTCPICRQNIVKNNIYCIILLNNIPYLVDINLFFMKYINQTVFFCKFISIFCFVLCIILSIEIAITTMKMSNKELQKIISNYTYDYKDDFVYDYNENIKKRINNFKTTPNYYN
jgi:hypothetical protein